MPKVSTLIKGFTQVKRALPLSYSKAQTLMQCPMKFKKRYIEYAKKTDAPDKESAVVGKAVHEVLQNTMVEAAKVGFDVGQVDFDLLWAQSVHPSALTSKEYDMARVLRSSTESVFQRMAGGAVKYGFKVYPEKRLTMMIDGTMSYGVREDQFFLGFMDFLGITQDCLSGVIVDYKTHRKSEDNAAAVDLQTKLYAYFTFLTYPNLKKLQSGCAYIPDVEIAMSAPLVRSKDFPALEQEVYEYFLRVYEAMRAEDYTPIGGYWCKWCEYTVNCPAFKKSKKSKK